jgi:hypothetical protein
VLVKAQQQDAELNNTTFDIYLHLVKARGPLGPRDIMREMGISSPGVVHRHLQKLSSWGWVDKDAFGRCMIRKRVGFKGHIWVGRHLLSTSVLFAVSFVILTASFFVILVIHLLERSPIDESFTILIAVTVAAAAFLLAEALMPKKDYQRTRLTLGKSLLPFRRYKV